MDMLRFTTAGSVDDGKSTLIGRLLLDGKALLEDQVAAARRASAAGLNLAFFTDGLKAERERGITIDVAYRYFSTPRRKFIVADCPGHLEFTRNMVTGASTADLAVVLVDAKNGLVEQTRRHSFVASLLGIPHLVLCVNKMDTVGWSQDVFEDIRGKFSEFSRKLEIKDVTFIPISALHGDNVVERSSKAPWYDGRPLLRHLEEVHVSADSNHIDMRFQVQCVIDGGFGGHVASGTLRQGDPVVVLPSGKSSRVKSLWLGGRELKEAPSPLSVLVRLTESLPAVRGDTFARPGNRPEARHDFDAMLCWMDERPLAPGHPYSLRHGARQARAAVDKVAYKLDINDLSRVPIGAGVGLNDFAKVALKCDVPVCGDSYRRNRATGSFILVEEESRATVAAGMIL